MKRSTLKSILCAGLLGLGLLPFGATAQNASAPKYSASGVINLPGDEGYDYLFIDQEGRKLYVSHGSSVNVVDLNTQKLAGTISGMGGTHGVAVVTKLNRGYISDGRENTVVAFDLKTLKIIKKIPLSSKGADAIIYDPASDKIFTFNGHSSSYSVVDPGKLVEVGTLDAKGAPEFAVSNGSGLIYNNLEDKSSLNVLDSKTLKIVQNYPLSPCGGPTGLALDLQNQRLFTVCRENKGMSVLDATSGKVITTVPIGAGVDAVVYDAAQKLVFVSNGDGTAMIFSQTDPDHYVLAQTLKTAVRAKTMALDTKTHKIYLSVADFQTGTRKPVAGSFKVLVFGPSAL